MPPTGNSALVWEANCTCGIVERAWTLANGNRKQNPSSAWRWHDFGASHSAALASLVLFSKKDEGIVAVMND